MKSFERQIFTWILNLMRLQLHLQCSPNPASCSPNHVTRVAPALPWGKTCTHRLNFVFSSVSSASLCNLMYLYKCQSSWQKHPLGKFFFFNLINDILLVPHFHGWLTFLISVFKACYTSLRLLSTVFFHGVMFYCDLWVFLFLCACPGLVFSSLRLTSKSPVSTHNGTSIVDVFCSQTIVPQQKERKNNI